MVAVNGNGKTVKATFFTKLCFFYMLLLFYLKSFTLFSICMYLVHNIDLNILTSLFIIQTHFNVCKSKINCKQKFYIQH